MSTSSMISCRHQMEETEHYKLWYCIVHVDILLKTETNMEYAIWHLQTAGCKLH